MGAWFLRLIGIGDDFVQHLDEVSLAVQHPAVLWTGMLVVACLAVWIYRRQRRNLASVPRALIVALTGIRVAILALLVITLSGPFLKIDHKNEKKPIVALLFDHSQSMQLPAGDFADDKELSRLAQAAGRTLPNGQLTPEVRKE